MSGERFSLFLSERDRFGELEAVWSFPSTTTAQQQLLLEHCDHRSQPGSLAEHGDSFVVKVVEPADKKPSLTSPRKIYLYVAAIFLSLLASLMLIALIGEYYERAQKSPGS